MGLRATGLTQSEPQIESRQASRTRTLTFSRRELLARSAYLGAGVTLSGGLASIPSPERAIASAAQSYESSSTLIVATNRVPTDLDPHSAFDPGSTVALHGQFETLITLKSGTTDQFAPLIAQSWESNEDASIWTFH